MKALLVALILLINCIQSKTINDDIQTISSSIPEDIITETPDDILIPPKLPVQPETTLNLGIQTTIIISDKNNCQKSLDQYNYCVSNPNDENCKGKTFSANHSYICSEANSINEDAKQIRKDNNFLFIYTSVNITELDLGIFNSENIINILGYPSLLNTIPDFPIDDDQMKNKNTNTPKSSIFDAIYTIGIKCNSQNTLKQLSFDNIYLTVLGSPINVEKLFITNVNLTPTSEIINCNIVDIGIHDYKDSIRFDKINTEKLVIYENLLTPGQYDPTLYHPQFTISYEQNKVIFSYRFIPEKEYREWFSIPYSVCGNLINFVTASNYIKLNVNNSNIKTTKDINITISGQPVKSFDAKLLDDQKYPVRLETTGDWSGIQRQTKVIFTSYQEYVSLDNRCNDKIIIEERERDILIPLNLPVQPEIVIKQGIQTTFIISDDKTNCQKLVDQYNYCVSNPNEEKCNGKTVSADHSYLCSDANNINEDAKQIRKDNKVLNIFTSVNLTEIDFNLLSNNDKININGMPMYSFLLPDFSIDDNRMQNKNRKTPKMSINGVNYIYSIGIKCNDQNKIKALSLMSVNITILGSPINIGKLEVSDTYFTPSSEKINCDTLAVALENYIEDFSFDKINKLKLELIDKQTYGSPDFSAFYHPQFMISYEQDKVIFYFKNVFDKEFHDNFTIPFSECGDLINFVTCTNYIKLHVNNSSITKTKNINITIFDSNAIKYTAKLLDDQKYPVRLETTGDWSGIQGQTKILFTSYQEYVSLDNQCNDKILIEKREGYDFSQDNDDNTNTVDQIETSSNNNNDQEISSIPVDIITKTPDDLLMPPKLPVQPEVEINLGIQTTILITDEKDYCQKVVDQYNYCVSNPNDEKCKDKTFSADHSYICSEANTINEDAKQIRKDNNNLFIYTSVNITEIDLSLLISSEATLIYGFPYFIQQFYPNFPIEDDRMKNKNRKIPKRTSIMGNIVTCGIKNNNQNKLKSLFLMNLDVTVLGSPINVERLNVSMFSFTPESEKINCDFLGISVDDYKDDFRFDKVNMKRMEIFDDTLNGDAEDKNFYHPYFMISYEQEKVIFYYEEVNRKDNNGWFSIPYSICGDLINFVTASNYIRLNVNNSNIKTTKDINITISGDSFKVFGAKLLDDQKYPVRLETTGDWSGIQRQTKVIFTSYQEYVSLDNRCNDKIIIEERERSADDIIIDEPKREDVSIGTIDKIENSTQLKTDIENKFKDNADKDKDKDLHIFIDSKENEQIVFENLSLDSNQYIKLNNNASVLLNNGSLNLLLDNNTKSIKVTVDDYENVELSIKNNVESTIEIGANTDSDDTSKKDIKITSKSEVFEPMTIKIADNVGTVKMESINLHSSGSLIVDKSEDTSLVVTTITAKPQTKCMIKNVEIGDTLTISQSASLNLENVNLQKAKLNLSLVSYNANSYKTPLLNGDLGNSPESIVLSKPNGESPEPDTDYILFEGNFNDGCENWAKKVQLDNDNFNQAKCNPLNNNYKLLDRESLVLRKDTGAGDGSGGNGGNKSSTGKVVGIVIGCIIGVAVIIAIIVVVAKKKKRQNTSSVDLEPDVEE